MSNEGLNILIVSPSLPYPFSGFGTRVWQLIRHLSGAHRVTVLTFVRPDEAETIPTVAAICGRIEVVMRPPSQGLGRRVSQLLLAFSPLPYAGLEQRTRQMQSRLDALVAAEGFDIVLMESTRLGALTVPAGPAVIYDEHNIEYELLRRMREGERSRCRRVFNGLEYHKFKRLEHRCWNTCAGVALTSDREEPIVRSHAPHTPTAVVPNGVDVDFFAPTQQEPEPMTVVFTGMLSYRPNLDAAQLLVDEIMPRVRHTHPDALLRIVGHIEQAELERLRDPHVDVTGWVLDVRVPMAQAAVVVAPLRMGGGTRLKIVEALGMGKAVISTTVGCEGLAVNSGEHLLVADDPDSFAGEVVRVLSDPQLARRLGAAGRALAVREYSWTRSGARLEELFRRVTGATCGTAVGPPSGVDDLVG
ncbi:MAG TPA: glycosyltransferase [Actinomycetota bacterium]|nr:glycosyltransferase [Actinomycetota bacterium]